VRRIVLLGSTGSIGTQTLDVVRSRRDQFGVVALAASGRNTGLLAEQVAAFLPARVAVADSEAIPALRHELAVRGVKMPQLLTGPEAAAELASSDCDVVLNAITSGQTAAVFAHARQQRIPVSVWRTRRQCGHDHKDGVTCTVALIRISFTSNLAAGSSLCRCM